MKVSNSQKSDKAADGVSRDSLNDWQRKEAGGNKDEADHRRPKPNDVGKQAEG